MGKDFIIGEDEFLKEQDHSRDGFVASGEEWGQPCHESFRVQAKPFHKGRRNLFKTERD
jgi:hypothetical protein